MSDYTFRGLCKGTTKAGMPCKRTVVFANGYCKAHGGDSTEYMRLNFQRQLEKAKRRAERFTRRLNKLRGKANGGTAQDKA
jgi:hypothetical protein